MYGPKDVDDHLKEVHANNYFKNDMELDFKGTKEQLVTKIYSLNAFGYQFYPQFHLVPVKVSEKFQIVGLFGNHLTQFKISVG